MISLTDDGRRTHGEQIDRTFTTKLLPLAVLLSLLALTTKFWQRIPLNNTSNFEYAVVLDAGSTGSRVLGFTFQRDPETLSLRLLDELWMQVKPGLSAYHVSFFTNLFHNSKKWLTKNTTHVLFRCILLTPICRLRDIMSMIVVH